MTAVARGQRICCAVHGLPASGAMAFIDPTAGTERRSVSESSLGLRADYGQAVSQCKMTASFRISVAFGAVGQPVCLLSGDTECMQPSPGITYCRCVQSASPYPLQNY
jgi:hypothetical protein